MLMLFFDRSNGIVNNVIAALGGERYSFLTDPKCFDHLYTWSGVWQGLGWGTIIYLAALSSISPELIEAARIDGASPMRFFCDIVFPLSKTNLAALFVITFIYGWNQYLWPLLIITDVDLGTTVQGLKG